MLTKSVFEKLRLLEALKCLSKICGEFLAIISRISAHKLFRKRETLFNTLEASHKRYSICQIRVCSWIRNTQLSTGGNVLSWLMRRNTNHSRTVFTTPGCIGRNSITIKTLIGINRWVSNKHVLGSVLNKTCNVVLSKLRKVGFALSLWSPEQRLAIVVKKRLIQKHG